MCLNILFMFEVIVLFLVLIGVKLMSKIIRVFFLYFWLCDFIYVWFLYYIFLWIDCEDNKDNDRIFMLFKLFFIVYCNNY